MMPSMDYSRLLGRMVEHGYTQKSLAEAIGVSESHFCQKLGGKFPFKQSEMQRICDVLSIPPAEIGCFFFCPKS